jgi:hypothetical protein
VESKTGNTSDIDLGCDQEYERWKVKVLDDKEVRDRVGNLGMDTESVLSQLHHYCRPYATEVLHTVREQARIRRNAGSKLDKAVQELQTAFEQVADNADFKQLVAQSDRLRSELNRYRVFLDSWDKDHAAASSEKGKARNDRVLFELAVEVFESTGEPHWSDLAYLITGGLSAYGIEEDVTPASISQRVTRFVASYPSLEHPFQELLCDPSTNPTRNRLK